MPRLAQVVLACWPLVLAAVAGGCAGLAPTRPASLHSNLPPELLLQPSATPAAAPGGILRKGLRPSNFRDWAPELALLSTIDIDGSQAKVRNIRNCQWRSEQDFTVRHYDKTFDLDQLDSVDFFMVPFSNMPALAHTMISFGFGGRDYLVVSVEIRHEKGETYQALQGLMNQYEIMYLVADERDLVLLRTMHRLCDVYLYHTRATPRQARELFLDVAARVNQLAAQPEFYNTITNNCTTNIVQHINRLSPNRVPYDYRVLLPGLIDQYAYELGLLDTELPFEQAKARARINPLTYAYRDAPDFSQRIRGR
jgi:hypothetical protein